MSADVVELIGNPRAGSRTRILADAATTAIVGALDAAGVRLAGRTTLELAEIVAVSFGPGTAVPTTTVDDPHGIVRSARLLVVATPTYKGTYTGLLKIFLDQYGHRELTGVVAVPVGIAAAEAHRQSVGATLRDLLIELGATVPVPPLALLEKELEDPDRAAADWVSRHGALLTDAFSTDPVDASTSEQAP
jgi:FMN reductase